MHQTLLHLTVDVNASAGVTFPGLNWPGTTDLRPALAGVAVSIPVTAWDAYLDLPPRVEPACQPPPTPSPTTPNFATGLPIL